ncbi:MAG: IS66 family transposase [Nanoarchaeota archaeon]
MTTQDLEKENVKLRREIERLRDENESIKKEKERIENEKHKLEKEFEEFKANHTITVENLRNAMHIKPDSKKAPALAGAKKGHTGYSRRIPERIDYVKQLIPDNCPDCGSPLLGKTQEIRSRHVTDIKLVTNAKTTRYDLHRKYCTNCKKLVEPDVPNVLPHARFGLNLMLLIMYLRLGLRLPGNKVCDYLLTLYRVSISEGEIVHVLKQLALAYGDYYTHLEKIVKLARVKHSDSTSWRINGKNYHAWVFIACGVVIYKIRKRNNHKVPLSVFGTKQKGNTLVVDRFAAFRTLAQKTGFRIQVCWSHLLQDSKELANAFGAEGRYVHRKLKSAYATAKDLNHKGTTEQVDQLRSEIFSLTRRHYTHKTVRRFVNTLWEKELDNLFRFVTDPEIDSTNNISERELRSLVIIRKISNGSRSPRGANATALLLSIIQTLRFSKQNVLEGLQTILKNHSGY